MRRRMRGMVGASVMAVSSILALGATAHATPAATADATAEDSAAAAPGWQRRGPFGTYAACDRVRSQLVSLGYATRPCYNTCPSGCTAPGPSWYYDIYV
jgi:hypothetical protein